MFGRGTWGSPRDISLLRKTVTSVPNILHIHRKPESVVHNPRTANILTYACKIRLNTRLNLGGKRRLKMKIKDRLNIFWKRVSKKIGKGITKTCIVCYRNFGPIISQSIYTSSASARLAKRRHALQGQCHFVVLPANPLSWT